MPSSSARRRWTFLVGTLGLLAFAFVCFVAYDLHWIRQRHQARDWLEKQPASWYAPSLVGAKRQASPPCCLALFGEQGMVGIGMDVEEFAGPVPYSREQLARLFPEARVDRSINGRYFDDQDE